MNLTALLLSLLVERLATRWFQFRRMRWIDRLIDAGFGVANRVATWPALIPVILLAFLLVLPVAVIAWLIPDVVAGLPYVAFAIVILFFSFGPQDIGEEVDEYCSALESGDAERIEQTAKAIIEGDVPDDELDRIHAVEAAVCVQANNRLFAVIFWFVALGPFGPLGAWTYRVTDLIRRRAVFSASREDGDGTSVILLRDAAVRLHGWLAFIPARLTAIGYAAAGHFDDAIGAWRAPSEEHDDSISESNEKLLARMGVAALALHDGEDDLTDRGVRGATAANRLVFRLLIIWAVVIGAMTLYGLYP
ncbi:MAG: regulatory signaling modulator protein AmpE [Pseudomonadota bacterium]